VETEIPEGLRYTDQHEWVRVEEDVATIGLTDYAQDQLGDIVYLDLPAVGVTVVQSTKENMGEVESVKAVSEIFSPVSGEVVEVNQEAVDAPELVNKEPYGRGWLVKVSLSDPSELDKLLSPEAYKKLVDAEVAEEAEA
jgi:glycine cleavage system H protein